MKVFITGGDGFGWALDEDLKAARKLFSDFIFTTNISDAEIVYSIWPRKLLEIPENDLINKKIICAFDNPPSFWIRQPEFARLFRIVGLWVCHSRQSKEEAESLQLNVIYFPYILGEEFLGTTSETFVDDEKKRLGIPNNVYLIGNFQRDTEGQNLKIFKKQKGPDIFVELLRVLQERGLSFHVVLAGPRRHWVIKELETSNIGYTYFGDRKNNDDLKSNLLTRECLAKLYRIIDIYVLPSRWEGGPYAILEAIGMKTKIISTGVGLAGEILSKEAIFENVYDAAAKIEKDIQSNYLTKEVDVNFTRLTANYVPDVIERYKNNLKLAVDNASRLQLDCQARVDCNHAYKKNIINKATEKIKKSFPYIWKNYPYTISIVRKFVKPPYGGANQFLLALKKEFLKNNIQVLNNKFDSRIDAYLLDSIWFDEVMLNDLEPYFSRPRIHRLDGIIHSYRGSEKIIDDKIYQINKYYSSASVIQSFFSLKQIYSFGYSPTSPCIIHNASDPDIFFPDVSRRIGLDPKKKIRLIATSWSDNPRKGGAFLEWIDDNIDFSTYQVTFVGNSKLRFKNIKKLDPCESLKLSQLIRQHDIYLALSQNESCSNALIEAMSCGLPVLYYDSGSYSELIGAGGISFKSTDEIISKLTVLASHYENFRKCVLPPTIQEVAAKYKKALFGN